MSGYTGYIFGGNPDNPLGLWDTEQEAYEGLAKQILEVLRPGDELYVRGVTNLEATAGFEGSTKKYVIGFRVARRLRPAEQEPADTLAPRLHGFGALPEQGD